MSIVVLGVGNELRGDDSVGLEVARRLAEMSLEDIIAYDCGPMPENFTQKVQISGAETAILVDAADMGLNPGGCRIVAKSSIHMENITTHSLPLRFLMEYLESNGTQAVLIGIQPEGIELGTEMSESARNAVDKVVEEISSGRWRELGTI